MGWMCKIATRELGPTIAAKKALKHACIASQTNNLISAAMIND